MIDFTAETQRSAINQAVALVARIFADFRCLKLGVAAMAQGTIIVANKSRVGQLSCAHLAAEAIGMPASVHRLNDASDDDVPTLVAVGSKKDSEILLAILAALKLVEDSVLEGAEALGAAGKIN